MGGSSFLLNKKFHPARLDNQKKVFIAEQKDKEKKTREEEAAKEIQKEKEISYYENLGEISIRDPRQSSLKFMYSAPSSNKLPINSNSKTVIANSSNGEDPAVAAFWAKINDKKNKPTEEEQSANVSSSSSSTNIVERTNSIFPFDKRQKKDLSEHPLLKNAPREGSFVKNMSNAMYKPFSEKLRNVQCSLCGEWGHRFGDRECALREYNPHDYARLKREDPMTYFSEKLPEDKQLMVLNEAAATTKYNSSIPLATNDEDEESDPEAEFLATLTAREKKLLLRKLQILQGEAVPPLPDSDSSSSDDSSDSSSASSDDSRSNRKERKRKHKKSEKKRSHKASRKKRKSE